MTARQIRRAEEHKSRKAAYQAARHGSNVSVPESPAQVPTEQTVERAVRAGQATAPAPELQAVKVCTGQTMILPAADAPAYRTHLDNFFSRLNPEGPRESEIVQTLADLQWRLNRISNLEQGLYAYGRVQYAQLFAQHDEADLRASLIDSHTLITHAKQFSHLAAQELRLFRYSTQHRAELAQMQEERARLARLAEEEESHVAPTARTGAAQNFRSRASGSIGFEFSSGENCLPSSSDFDYRPLHLAAATSANTPVQPASTSQER